jgi:hypothetical protein
MKLGHCFVWFVLVVSATRRKMKEVVILFGERFSG